MNEILKNIKQLTKQLKCKHTHMFQHYLPSDTVWLSNGKRMGPHDGLLIQGCYICGKVWCRDYKS